MKTVKISEQTHQAITNYQNYLYQKQGQKWTFDELINIAICNDFVNAQKIYEKKQYHFDDEHK